MSTKDDGGPAFPNQIKVWGDTQYSHAVDGGMTLRDYFAAKAMLGFLTMPNKPTLNGQIIPKMDEKHIANMAYCVADAMLAERSKL